MGKSQVSHIFIFALGIIILALIMIFGYRVINELRLKGEETTLIHFKEKLISDIKVTRAGDVYQKSYTIPQGYREVCFVDKSHILDGISLWHSELYNDWGTEFLINEPELSNAIRDRVKDNVFVIGESKVDSLFVGNIDLGKHLDDGSEQANKLYAVYCFEIKNSKLNIQLEKEDDAVLIKRPE